MEYDWLFDALLNHGLSIFFDTHDLSILNLHFN